MKSAAILALMVVLCSVADTKGQINMSAPADGEVIIKRIQELELEPAFPGQQPVRDAAFKLLFFQLDPASYPSAARQLITPNTPRISLDLEILRAWGSREPKAVIEFIQKNDPDLLTWSDTYELFRRWAMIDPDGALEAAKNVSNNRKNLILAVLAVIAVDSPARALELLPVSESRQYGFAQDAFAHWAGKSPIDALKWAMNEAKRTEILWTLGFVWAQRDRPKAEDWIKTLKGDDRTCALAGMIYERVAKYSGHQGDPELAAREFIAAFSETTLSRDSIPDSRVRELASAIAMRLPARGPNFDGLEWARSFKPSLGRDEISDTMMRNWTKYGPKEALPYIVDMKPGKRKDFAAMTYVYSQWKGDSRTNFNLASSIQDEGRRQHSLADVFEQWLLKSPEEAIQALQDLPDPEESKIKSLMAIYASGLRRQSPRED